MTARPLLVGQSADPDDAFMAWALPAVLREHDLAADLEFSDIDTLNRQVLDGRLDLAAISVAVYPRIAGRYRMLRAGASFGDGYGPIVVGRARPPRPGVESLAGLRVATPGPHTTASLLLRIYAADRCDTVDMRFDRILEAVREGAVDAGLIIHEGQLTYEQHGLHALFEPAREWRRDEGLPLPLGAVVVRRALPEALQRTLAESFAHSIHRAFEEPDEALGFAARYARGLDRPALAEYVHRYVNAATLDMGSAGERAIARLFELGARAGLLDRVPVLDLL